MIFIFASCSQDKSLQNELRLCINTVVNEYTRGNYGKNSIDFNNLMMEIEHKLSTSTLIDNNKRKNYKQLFAEIIEEKNDLHEKFYTEAVSLMDKKGYDFNLYVINNAICTKCPYEILIKMDNYKTEFY